MYVYGFVVLELTETILFTTRSDADFSDDLFPARVFLGTELILKMKSQKMEKHQTSITI